MSDSVNQARAFEVLTATPVRSRRAPRDWSDDDKARLVSETLLPGANTSAIARAAGLDPSQLYGWRRKALASGSIAALEKAYYATYATLAHELTHWTKHKNRLDRELGRKKWGDEGYAREKLVAELGAAFLCADLELTPEPGADHAAYIQGWLKVLKEDKRAIFSAAAHAQRAADFLHGLQSVADTKEGAAA